MPYALEITPDAEADIDALDRMEVVTVRQALALYLRDQPDVATRRRKRMAPNPVGAVWALRLDELRVYYDIDQAARIVRVLRIGRKVRERVTIRGVVTDMRETKD